jgi:hypothetical protein
LPRFDSDIRFTASPGDRFVYTANSRRNAVAASASARRAVPISLP